MDFARQRVCEGKQRKTTSEGGNKAGSKELWDKTSLCHLPKSQSMQKRLVQLTLRQKPRKKIEEATGDARKTWKLVQ